MIIFQNKKTFLTKDLNSVEKTISTLLVPSHLLEPLKQRVKVHGKNFTRYFENLLRQYRIFTHSGMIPDPRKIKTEYQIEGLGLRRINFLVSNSDWLELGELALAFGKSRCWVFTFLLEIDLAGFWKILTESGLNQGVPKPASQILKVSLALERYVEKFSRSYYVRV